MRYILSQHAQDVVKEREIQEHWIEQVLSHPEKSELDRIDPMVEHCLGRISDHGNRVLRVIVNKQLSPWQIVTAFLTEK
jgi:uncharacterized protein DUF4258